MLTPVQKTAFLVACHEVASVIRDFTQHSILHGIPSGELYALLMPSGISLEMYTTIIEVLKRSGLVTEANYLLTYTGPDACPAKN